MVGEKRPVVAGTNLLICGMALWVAAGMVRHVSAQAQQDRVLDPQLVLNKSLLVRFGFMATIPVSEARDRLPDAVQTARTEAVFLQRYGRAAAVLISPERYEQLIEAEEDAEDIAAFDAALAEEGPNIPWEQVKADLGWA